VLLLEQRPEQRQEQEKPDIIIPDLTIDPYIPLHMSQEPRGQGMFFCYDVIYIYICSPIIYCCYINAKVMMLFC